MVTLLQKIVDLFVCWIETGVMTVLNLVIAAFAVFIQALFDVLPSFPSVTMPTLVQNGFAYISYWFPMSWFLTNLAIFIAFTLAWFVIAIPLRWGKATRGSE